MIYMYIFLETANVFSFQRPFHCQAGADRVVATEVPEIPWGFQIKFSWDLQIPSANEKLNCDSSVDLFTDLRFWCRKCLIPMMWCSVALWPLLNFWWPRVTYLPGCCFGKNLTSMKKNYHFASYDVHNKISKTMINVIFTNEDMISSQL